MRQLVPLRLPFPKVAARTDLGMQENQRLCPHVRPQRQEGRPQMAPARKSPILMRAVAAVVTAHPVDQQMDLPPRQWYLPLPLPELGQQAFPLSPLPQEQEMDQMARARQLQRQGEEGKPRQHRQGPRRQHRRFGRRPVRRMRHRSSCQRMGRTARALLLLPVLFSSSSAQTALVELALALARPLQQRLG